MPGTPVKNLSRKATEQLTLKILARTPMAESTKLVYVKGLSAEPLKGKRWPKGTALPPGNDVFARETYRVGDGDPWAQAGRPGADDNLKHLSLASTGEAKYLRGHK